MDNIGEILVPIIIFIIWTLSSIAESKKKRKRQQAPKPAEFPAPQPSQSQQTGESTSSTSTANPMEDLKRSLDKLFGEMSGETNPPAQNEQQPAPEYEEETEPAPEYRRETEPIPEYRKETEPVPEYRTKMEPAPEYRKKEKAAQIPELKESYRDRFKQEQLALRKFYDNYSSDRETTGIRVTAESLRETIVLMEVLSAPVALRE